MPVLLRYIHVLCIFLPGLLAEPNPGRIPKVYNALITSNQNLEPSKAYPVFQPVLHDPFAFPFQPLFYGGNYPFGNAILPVVPHPKGVPEASPSPATEGKLDTKPPSSEIASTTSPAPAPSKAEEPKVNNPASSDVPPPPPTQSPIPLNEFGLPPHVLPLGRIDPAFNGFNQIGPYPYTFPGFKFYEIYDPFGFTSYASTPFVYGTLTNVLGHNGPVQPGKEEPATVTQIPGNAESTKTPPPEPTNLNVLNYSSSDPNIPNVPPPPLPEGGLKTDKME